MGVATSEPVASSVIMSPARADAGALSLAPGRVWLLGLRKVLKIGASVHPPHPVMTSAEAMTESTGKTLRREGKWVLLSGGDLRRCRRGGKRGLSAGWRPARVWGGPDVPRDCKAVAPRAQPAPLRPLRRPPSAL